MYMQRQYDLLAVDINGADYERVYSDCDMPGYCELLTVRSGNRKRYRRTDTET